MRTADVVIGANYGDEGKGLFTSYLVERKWHQSPVVVRFNGGAQAGHTVVTPGGKRHVFGHFGSGSLSGARTYLSRFFVVNPSLYVKERAALNSLGWNMTRKNVMIDARCPVTTPADMLINQTIEKARGSGRHGSCGVGFGETLERTGRPDFEIYASYLSDTRRLKDLLKKIYAEWVPFRMKQLGFEDRTDEVVNHPALSGAGIEKYLYECEETNYMSRVVHPDEADDTFVLVFEGAQGLLLDQNHANFPHVTRSNTGLTNVMALIEEFNINTMNVHYVTRHYLTRHGAGPLENELQNGLPYPNFEDKTNLPHQFQGTLRFGLLNADTLGDRINSDFFDGLSAKPKNLTMHPHLVITCLDQTDADGCVYFDRWDSGYVYDDNNSSSRETDFLPAKEFPNELAARLGINSVYWSDGPAAGNVHWEYVSLLDER